MGQTISLSTSQKKEPVGIPLPANTADNGLSIGLVSGEVVLGQDVGQAGNPATLLSNREIPTNGFSLALNGTGSLLLGTTANAGNKLQIVHNQSGADSSAAVNILSV